MIWSMVILAVLGTAGFAVYFSSQYTLVELLVGSLVSLTFSLGIVMPVMLIVDEWAQGVTEGVGKWAGVLVDKMEKLPPVVPNEEGRLVCGVCGCPVLKVGDRVYYGCDYGNEEHK